MAVGVAVLVVGVVAVAVGGSNLLRNQLLNSTKNWTITMLKPCTLDKNFQALGTDINNIS